jgi:hypothetical protein
MRLSNYTLFLFTSSVVVYFRSDRKDKYSFEIMIGAPGTKEQDHEVELVKIGVAFHNRTLTVVVKPVSSQGDPIIAVHKTQEILSTDTTNCSDLCSTTAYNIGNIVCRLHQDF